MMEHTDTDYDFHERDTIPSWPAESLRPPRVPSDLGPYSRHVDGQVAMATVGFAGAGSALYLGFELARHWDLGGWIGVAWLTSIIVAAGLAGATIAMVLVFRGLRRG